MKTCSKFLVCLGIGGWTLATICGASTDSSDVAGSIQSIQQASDPSAAVAAYANGVALDRNNPKLYEAYINRMVDFGLPEMAYHQAQTVTVLQPDDGRAWGVVAYVEARRGNMTDAISAISIAGQHAPNDQFVQRTAGEVAAWYDLKADKTKLPSSAQDGLASIHHRLNNEAAFQSAYDTAKQAYQTQSSTSEPPASAPTAPQSPAQPQGQQQGDPVATPPLTPPADYYAPDYYYAAGPRWIEPVPWWWWQPVGFFAGFNFCPFPGFFVFDDDDFFFFHHHFFDRDDFFFHHDFDDFFHHDRDDFFHHHDHDDFAHHFGSRDWHHDAHAGSTFFGQSAKPNATMGTFARNNFQSSSMTTAFNRTSAGGIHSGITMMRNSPANLNLRSTFSGGAGGQRWNPPTARGPVTRSPGANPMLGRQMNPSSPMMRPGFAPRFRPDFNRGMMPPAWRGFAGNPMFRSPPAGWSGRRFGPPVFARPGGMAMMRGGARGGGFGSGGRGGGFGSGGRGR